MPRFFNTAGPNDSERHYTLPVLVRLPDVRRTAEGLKQIDSYLPQTRAVCELYLHLLPMPWVLSVAYALQLLRDYAGLAGASRLRIALRLKTGAHLDIQRPRTTLALRLLLRPGRRTR